MALALICTRNTQRMPNVEIYTKHKRNENKFTVYAMVFSILINEIVAFSQIVHTKHVTKSDP